MIKLNAPPILSRLAKDFKNPPHYKGIFPESQSMAEGL